MAPSHTIILSVDLTNCGKAETLAHELGHIALFDASLSENLDEIAADLVQYGVMRLVAPEHDTADLTARFLAGRVYVNGISVIEMPTAEKAYFQGSVLAAVAKLNRP